ncbi:MAG: NADH-quinone oxidoreductase subunit NuoK [Alphaproteobacteria bacterium]|jgi:NADH-quinone oxidoreductase subunit K|nr:NADH-quinone oxidoreductase subunit NuoK [Alphaproteobacteria bacterium]
MEITIFHYLILSGLVFFIGIFGIFLNRKSIVSLIMSVEVIFLAININFIIFSNYWSDFKGQIFVLFILTVSATEIAIALVALIVYFNSRFTTVVDDLSNLRG